MKRLREILYRLIFAVAIIGGVMFLGYSQVRAEEDDDCGGGESACYVVNDYMCVKRCAPKSGCNCICEYKQYTSCDSE